MEGSTTGGLLLDGGDSGEVHSGFKVSRNN